MDAWTVFYSWQSDLPCKYNKDFIEEAAESAIAQLQLDATIEESPRLDHGVKGTSGIPDIASTIYTKIEQCDVFLADVSFVGATDSAVTQMDAKRLLNPNVGIELGYAAKAIGWDRIVTVMNTKHGGPEVLPFDLRSRSFPIGYNLDDRERKIDETRAGLASRIMGAITLCQQTRNELVAHTVSQLDIYSINLIRKFGNSPHFWTEEPDKKGIPIFSELSVSIPRLLELKVIRTVFREAEGRYVYSWSRLGRLCAKYLGQVVADLATGEELWRPVVIDEHLLDEVSKTNAVLQENVFFHDKIGAQ